MTLLEWRESPYNSLAAQTVPTRNKIHALFLPRSFIEWIQSFFKPDWIREDVIVGTYLFSQEAKIGSHMQGHYSDWVAQWTKRWSFSQVQLMIFWDTSQLFCCHHFTHTPEGDTNANFSPSIIGLSLTSVTISWFEEKRWSWISSTALFSFPSYAWCFSYICSPFQFNLDKLIPAHHCSQDP